MGVPINIKPIEIYQSIDDMILFNFDRYMATQDNNWFRKDYTGREPKIQSEELKKVSEIVLEEYFTAIDDRTLTVKLQKWFQISELTKTYNVLTSVVAVLYAGFDDSDAEQKERIKLIMLLNKGYGVVKFKMDLINSPIGDREQLLVIQNQLQGIKTKIALIQSELKDDGKSEQKSLYKQLRIISNALGQKEISNPKSITVAQWIADCQLCNEIAKQN